MKIMLFVQIEHVLTSFKVLNIEHVFRFPFKGIICYPNTILQNKFQFKVKIEDRENHIIRSMVYVDKKIFDGKN